MLPQHASFAFNDSQPSRKYQSGLMALSGLEFLGFQISAMAAERKWQMPHFNLRDEEPQS
jgi:hypothetical protein